MADLAAEAAKGRRAGLVALRDLLATQLSDGGHVVGCSCDCGIAADGRVVATLAKQLAAVMAELDALPGAAEGEGSKVVSLSDRVAQKRNGPGAVGRDSAAAV